VLIRADKNPNSFGVQERFGAARFDPAAGHDLVLVWGEFPDRAALGSGKVIHLATFGAAWATPADVVLPISTTFERSGTFSNFEGKASSFKAVFDKAPQVQHAADVFKGLAA
jgi:NADH dehydrogenase/NADH:ubiquinone oxidoreductase subunit G